MRFTISGPPVPKARARVVAVKGQRPRGVTPERTRTYEQHVKLIAWAARSTAPAWPLAALYTVEIEVYRATSRGDIDNFAKAILDGCNGVLWVDDGQVRDLRITVREDKAQPRVEVCVSPGAQLVSACPGCAPLPCGHPGSALHRLAARWQFLADEVETAVAYIKTRECGGQAGHAPTLARAPLSVLLHLQREAAHALGKETQ